jgi:UMF1 family MFS transporter
VGEDAELSTRGERIAWCTFDFANSAFPTVALTAFGAPYFTSVLAADGIDLGFATLGPAAAWGAAISTSMAVVTVSAPITGAIADRSNKKRALLALYVAICVAATIGLGFVPRGAGLAAFALYVVANFAFEGAYVFYNAFLPELVPKDRIGRLSGQGWAFGYVGGLLALFLCRPLVPDDYASADAGAASTIFFVIAAWYAAFSLPVLLVLRDRARLRQDDERSAEPRRYVTTAFRELARTLRSIRAYRVIALFLVAYFLYNDAITTVIEFVGIFTKEVLAFTPKDNIALFLVLNVIAAPGALLFGHLLDRIGGKRAISISLVLWVVVVIAAATTTSREAFFGVAALAAVVIGATQASSRALLARIAPRRRVGEFMGFLALSGKASAILGPTVYGLVAEGFAEPGDGGYGHRVAISVIGAFFLVALLVLSRVDEVEGMRRAHEEDASAT